MDIPAWRAELDERLQRKLAGKNILLASNEDDITELVTGALAPYGCEVEVVATAVAARAAAGDRTSLLLLRLVLPDLSGRHLVTFFEVRACADMPIIVLRRRGDPRGGTTRNLVRTVEVPCHESELLAVLDAFFLEPRQR